MSDLYQAMYNRIMAQNPYTARMERLNQQIREKRGNYTGMGEEAREERARATRDLDKKLSRLQNEERGWLSDQFKQGVADTRTDLYSQLESQKRQNMQSVANHRETALQQMTQRNDQLRRQAQTALAQPTRAPNAVPSFNPLDPTVDVGTNEALAGGNAATSKFYVAPESTQSRVNVSAPIGGGITGRNKASTDRLVSETDTLGARRKDEL